VLPFDDSRRLVGGNLYFAAPGAVLESALPVDAPLIDAWRTRVAAGIAALAWPAGPLVARPHSGGGALAFAAPIDQLFTATELNEWALCAALAALGRRPADELLAALAHAAEVNPLPESRTVGLPPVLDQDAAFARLRALAAKERNPKLRALLDAAEARGLPWLLDDEALTLGHGVNSRTHSLDSLPASENVRWERLKAIPLAVVTGSNGKTTTVRAIAAALADSGLVPGYSCTDGVFVGGHALGSGDYSGPQGARRVLRDARTQAAVLEVARGGILRRGLAMARADAAVVTNVSADHFGEYGVHTLEDLADAKLAVARLVGADGLLVLNADDALLRARGAALVAAGKPVGWSALTLDAARAQKGIAACGAREGRLVLVWRGAEHDLGAVAALPLTADGTASYNLANLASAALAAAACGAAPATIAALFARFGSDPGDNPGRLMRYALGGLTVLVDYAHNAEGLEGLLAVAAGLRGAGSRRGRLVLLLGHAGNRQQQDFERLAAAAIAGQPELVIVKEIEGFVRGRAPGEVPDLIRAALLAQGYPAPAINVEATEIGAVRHALAWARAGDVVVLPVHALAARAMTLALIDTLLERCWVAGAPLP
jgi:cyanophycin synthetase